MRRPMSKDNMLYLPFRPDFPLLMTDTRADCLCFVALSLADIANG